jgi:hypothetical protein
MAITNSPTTSPMSLEIDWTIGSDDAETTRRDMILADIQAQIADAEALPLSTFAAPVMGTDACRDLITEEARVLAEAGIVAEDKQLFFAPGTALMDVGHDALAGYDAAFRALPPPATAVGDFHAQIAAEARQDLTVDLAAARINASGLLTTGEGAVTVGRTAWRQLTEVAGQPNVNAGLSQRQRAPRRVRTRAGGYNREAFGIVSADPVRGYAVFDGPQVADLMLAGLKDAGMLSGAKMTLDYDRESTRYDIRAVVQAPVDVPAFSGVGRVHQLFARVTGGDDGQSSVKGGIGALRIRCLNATLVEAKGVEWSQRHVGQDATANIRQLVAGMVGQFQAAADSLIEVWSRAAAHHYLDTDGTPLSVHEAITRLVANKHIGTGGLEADQAIDNYMAAWRAEDSPTSAAGILMAVQRAAHESTWTTSWARADLEEQASGLLYQTVSWALPEVEA